MTATANVDRFLGVYKDVLTSLVRRDSPDLTARQMTVLLNVYMTEEQQTVRGLALKMNVSKPAITRALDRLSEFSYVARKVDQADRRSIFVQRTKQGTVYIGELRDSLAEAATANGFKNVIPADMRVPANTGAAAKTAASKAA